MVDVCEVTERCYLKKVFAACSLFRSHFDIIYISQDDDDDDSDSVAPPAMSAKEQAEKTKVS